MLKVLSIVVPCYNEEAALPHTVATLEATLQRLIDGQLVSPESAIYFVDDGSRDTTWALIKQYTSASSLVHGIKLSGNRGHQSALMAGILNVPGDMVLSIDADLQDDPQAIESMVRHHLAGAEIVYGVRSQRETDTPFKRITALLYYKLLQRLGVRIILNHADYRLMGRAALNALAEYREVNLFVRGIVPYLGFSTATVEYARHKRVAGTSKYPLAAMLALAWNGITSFTAVPLRLIFIAGIIIALCSFLFGLWAVYLALFTSHAVPGWASITVPLFFLGGVQLLSMGIIGEYIGKIYMETKNRPRFHVETTV